jgi:hypothetical protein
MNQALNALNILETLIPLTADGQGEMSNDTAEQL